MRVNRTVNGFGFESPNVGTGTNAYQYDPTGGPAAVTYTGTAGVAGNGSALGNPDAPQGTQAGFVQGGGSFQASGTFPAGTYSLSFQAAQSANNVADEGFQVVIDGVALGGLLYTPGSNYTAFITPSFTLTAGPHTIQFAGLDPDSGNNDIVFIDDLQLLR